MTTSFYARRRRGLPGFLYALTIAVVLGVVIGLSFTACAPRDEAAAYPLTSVRNIGTLAQIPDPSVTVLLDNGTYVSLAAGQTRWAVRAIRIGKGQCIRIDGNPERCAIDRSAYNVILSERAYTVQRTR